MEKESYKKELYRKYLQNRCTPEEHEKVVLFLREADADPELEELMEEDACRQLARDEKIEFSVSAELRARILSRIQNRQVAASAKTRFLPLLAQPWLRVAAVLTLILLLGGLYYSASFNPAARTYSTAFGERKEITLPDQSVVTLNGNSRLRFAGAWDSDSPREVWLEGEGFFSVVHTRNHQRFVVKTEGQFQVEVLGTAFNVNSRRGNTQVVLKSGQVKLNLDPQQPGQEVLMQPGELVEYVPAKDQVTRKKVNPEVYSSWRNNKLIFMDTPLSEISRLLEDNYGYTVHISDPAVAAEGFTAVYPADKITVLLKALEKAFEVEIDPDQKKIVIGKSSPD